MLAPCYRLEGRSPWISSKSPPTPGLLLWLGQLRGLCASISALKCRRLAPARSTRRSRRWCWPAVISKETVSSWSACRNLWTWISKATYAPPLNWSSSRVDAEGVPDRADLSGKIKGGVCCQQTLTGRFSTWYCTDDGQATFLEVFSPRPQGLVAAFLC